MPGFDLGSIRATMGLDNSNFVAGMLDSRTAAGIFGQDIVNLVNNPLLGTISIFKRVAVGAAEVVKETAFANQEFARMADRTGASIRTLTGLRVAYEDFGLTVQDIEKTFSELAKRIEETRTSEDAKKRFADLGVQVKDTQGNLRGIDEILRDVSDGLANMEDKTRAMAIAQQLFGDKGVQLLSILGKGSEAIDDFRKKAENMGYVLTESAAKQSDRFAGALGDLKFSIDGVKEAMATAFIEGFAGNLTDAQLTSDGLARAIKDTLVPAVKELGEAMSTLLKILQPVLQILTLLQKADLGHKLIGGPILSGINNLLDRVDLDGDPVESVRRILSAQQRQIRALE
ncbi:MAG: phage tail tape measure protein [Phycisphaerales bacterium]|nr:phage tail tape measure protein [Phycisphaerales bacterium]